MDADLLKKVLNRCRKDEFYDLIQKWDYLPPESAVVRSLQPVNHQKNKMTLIADIVKESNIRDVPQEAVEELDLLYIQTHSKKKLWSVYQIVRSHNSRHKSMTPDTIRKKLKAELENYFGVSVSILPKDDAYWMRISLIDVGLQATSFVTYIIYHPQADYLIASGMKKQTLLKYLFQAFVTVTDGNNSVDLQLQGRCVKSLVQLSIGRQHQGSYSRLALNQVDGTALTTRSKKRKREEEDIDDYVLRVVNENRDDKRRRESEVVEKFGPNELPTLEKVTFECHTEFGGVEFAPAMAQNEGEIFQCTVKFEGPSVLEGIRNLAKAGLADLPMRRHLTTIQHMARNKFLIQTKRRAASQAHTQS